MAISLENIAELTPIFTEDYKPKIEYETLQQKYKSLTGQDYLGMRDGVSSRNYGEFAIFEMKDYIVVRREADNSSIYGKPADFKSTSISVEGLECVWDESKSSDHIYSAYLKIAEHGLNKWNAIAYERTQDGEIYEMQDYIAVLHKTDADCIYRKQK